MGSVEHEDPAMDLSHENRLEDSTQNSQRTKQSHSKMSTQATHYHFTRGKMGYRFGYGMTRARHTWTTFTKDEVERMERPYGCRSKGSFTLITQHK